MTPGILQRKIMKYASCMPCFYCGVDSTALKIFLFGLFGSVALGTVLFAIGMKLRGLFADPESAKYEVLEVEAQED